MNIKAAQADVRRIYRCGFVGPLVSGVLWVAAAAIAEVYNQSFATAFFFLSGIFIFPITSLILKMLGGPSGLPKGHPMTGLATQVAMTIPIGLLACIAISIFKPELFFATALLIVGAHYLPFGFLYGMKSFVVLASVLSFSAIIMIYVWRDLLPCSGWIGGMLLVISSLILYIIYRRSVRSAQTK